MNKIAEALLTDFVSTQILPADITKETQFEHFAAFLTVGPLLEESLDTSTCVVGGNAQPGVDAIATIVNGTLVTLSDEVETLAEINGYLDVDFMMIQAKTSPSFATSSLGDLGDFAERIFTSGTMATDNQLVVDFSKLKDFIYSKSKLFKKRNPGIQMFYVTTGQAPKGDKNFEAKEALIGVRLQKLGIFSDIKISLVGASDLQRRYSQMSNSATREIIFPRRVALPLIPGVTQAFVGVVPAPEFSSLLKSDAGGFMSSVFYDNVRDWQGLNEVNEGMLATLNDISAKERFVLMNNGVTVIAKKINTTGDKVKLEDYQIVNGCQTSNMLWRSNAVNDESVLIPLRIVATEDDSVVAAIISATNSQTAVSREQLLAATDFQKGLEQYFASQVNNPLFYERRSRQFSIKAVEKSRIVTPIGLIKSFSSMFLDEPHKTARDFGSVMKKVSIDIFNEKHQPEPYYLAALAYYWIDYLMKKEKIDSALRPARYQILLATRLLNSKEQMPSLESKKISGYISNLLPLFKDAASAEKTFKKPVELISTLLKGKNRDEPRTAPFTQNLKQAVLKPSSRTKAKGAH